MRLSRTVFEILSPIFQKLKKSRDSDHPYQGQFVIQRVPKLQIFELRLTSQPMCKRQSAGTNVLIGRYRLLAKWSIISRSDTDYRSIIGASLTFNSMHGILSHKDKRCCNTYVVIRLLTVGNNECNMLVQQQSGRSGFWQHHVLYIGTLTINTSHKFKFTTQLCL